MSSYLESITVLVAESHELTRLGLCALINGQSVMRLLDNTHCVDRLISLSVQYQPDVVLLDILLNNGQCIQQLPELQKYYPHSKILALTVGQNEQIMLELFQHGVAGVFNKNLGSELLLKAIQSIHAGELWFDRQLIRLLRHSYSKSASISAAQPGNFDQMISAKFTPRERSVVRLAIKGLPAKKIAQQLAISEKTVRNQLTVIYEKLHVANQVELCLKATQMGLWQLTGESNDRDKCPEV